MADLFHRSDLWSINLKRDIFRINVFFRIFYGINFFSGRFGNGTGCSGTWPRSSPLRAKLRAVGNYFGAIFFLPAGLVIPASGLHPARSEERRVGKEGR